MIKTSFTHDGFLHLERERFFSLYDSTSLVPFRFRAHLHVAIIFAIASTLTFRFIALPLTLSIDAKISAHKSVCFAVANGQCERTLSYTQSRVTGVRIQRMSVLV